jgi:hypothetical protein
MKPASDKPMETSTESAKATYRVRNWSDYNAALKQRGSLTVWLDEAVLAEWLNEQKTGRRGASNHYSDGAIALMATVQALFNLAGRQTQGFLESLFELMKLELPIPDHSTLSRRIGKLSVELPTAPVSGAIHLVVDESGVESLWRRGMEGADSRSGQASNLA